MEQFFPKEKIVKTGNPIRGGLLDIAKHRTEGLTYFQLNPEQKTLLVLGGSLGARRINQLVEEQLPLFEKLGGASVMGSVANCIMKSTRNMKASE